SPSCGSPGAARSRSWSAKESTRRRSKAFRDVETRLLSARSPADLDEAAALIRRGGLVAFPTETVYGLGALALEPWAVRAIYAAKGRPATNPLIVHVLGEDEARPLVSRWPLEAIQLAARFWPGPLTVVLPRTAIVPDECTAGGDTVGVRAPSHPAARALLERVGAKRGGRIGARLRGDTPAPAAVAVARLPDDPQGYARGLYAALRDLEDADCTAIVVEQVPPGPEWDAIRDRLTRAAAA